MRLAPAWPALASVAVALSAASVASHAAPARQAGRPRDLLFASGFERGVRTTGDLGDLVGSDGMDWRRDLEGLPFVAELDVNYEGGTEYATADVAADPTDADNRVLMMQVTDDDPRERGTTRSQLELDFKVAGAARFEEGTVRFRVLWDPAMQALREYPGAVTWFVIMEWWEEHDDNLNGDRAGQCRWNLSIAKDAGAGAPFYWKLQALHAQPSDMRGKEIWPKRTNHTVPVPIGKWATLDVYFKRGAGEHGRIVVTVKGDRGPPRTIFDVRDHTMHPESPMALRTWHFMKLYLDDKYLDWMRLRGKAVRVFYDDFELWGRRPGSGPLARRR